jgi:hypothetical protein
MVKRSLRLLLALVGFVLVGWAVGAVSRSTLTAIDLRVLEHIAWHRTSGQIMLAHASSLVGSGYVVFPLTLICSAILYLRG